MLVVRRVYMYTIVYCIGWNSTINTFQLGVVQLLSLAERKGSETVIRSVRLCF